MKYIFSVFVLLFLLTGCNCAHKYGSKNIHRKEGTHAVNGFLLTSNHLEHGHQNAQGQQYVTDRLFFGFDEHGLNAENKALLKDHAAWLNANPHLNILISGHCDARGTREYNIGLGARRAYAVKSFLLSQGILSHRIRVISKGKDAPLVNGTGDTIWAQNRAAVISKI